jgi:hypothetical protein
MTLAAFPPMPFPVGIGFVVLNRLRYFIAANAGLRRGQAHAQEPKTAGSAILRVF